MKIVGQTIKDDAKNIDYSARSLSKEWPEYHPAKQVDSQAKIDEIRLRPTRKQKFGVKSHQKYTTAYPSHADVNSCTLPKPRNAISNFETNDSAWQTKDDVIHFDSIEEMFGVPKERLAFIRGGQIAYRDGSRGLDGALPRARFVYLTGYAEC